MSHTISLTDLVGKEFIQQIATSTDDDKDLAMVVTFQAGYPELHFRVRNGNRGTISHYGDVHDAIALYNNIGAIA
ncbi:hypothetical protein EVC29_104 [Rhizobium phage RHph_Y52]|nr:hypothetical protein EVC16_104 [Rhizobium phage RHph_Y21]QIG76805.1 hypothetical protein EVC29_104 [Rhizobium phage RHph_Y52]